MREFPKTTKKLKDLTGHTIGRLTVLQRGENKNGQTTWDCVCVCGGKKTVDARSLKHPRGTKSCGCLREKWNEDRKELLETRKGLVLRHRVRSCLDLPAATEDDSHILNCVMCGVTKGTTKQTFQRGVCYTCRRCAVGEEKNEMEVRYQVALKRKPRYCNNCNAILPLSRHFNCSKCIPKGYDYEPE